VKECP